MVFVGDLLQLGGNKQVNETKEKTVAKVRANLEIISLDPSQTASDNPAAELIPAASGLEITSSPLMQDLAGQLAPRSRAIYENDTRHFATWLTEQNFTLQTITRSNFIQYRSHLGQAYAKATAARMLSVARRLMSEAVSRGDLVNNVSADIKGFKTGDNETPHHAMSDKEARQLLAVIDTSTRKGKRDYALVLLLLWTGLRRSEAAALTIGDLRQEGGHQVLTVQHGKGDKRRKVKVPVKAMRAISDYLEEAGRSTKPAAAPLFVGFNKGDHPEEKPISDKLIYRTVLAYAKAADIESLRSS